MGSKVDYAIEMTLGLDISDVVCYLQRKGYVVYMPRKRELCNPIQKRRYTKLEIRRKYECS